MFSWLLSPSEAFAKEAELVSSAAVLISTAVVVVGLIGEYLKRGWWERHRHFAEMLVLVGVAGELFADAGAFGYSIRVQAIEEKEIADTQKQADAALLAAGNLGLTFGNLHDFVEQKEAVADTQFKSFKSFSDDEKRRSDDVINELNADKNKLEKARTDALAAAEQTQKDLAAMDAALAKERALQQQALKVISPRSFSQEQKVSFLEHLKQFQGTPVSVWRISSASPDAPQFAVDINSLLHDAQWQTRAGISVSNGTVWVNGVLVLRRAGSSSSAADAVVALIRELRDDGMTADRGPDLSNEGMLIGSGMGAPVDGPTPDVYVVIGGK